jgi:hypothetical protein
MSSFATPVLFARTNAAFDRFKSICDGGGFGPADTVWLDTGLRKKLAPVAGTVTTGAEKPGGFCAVREPCLAAGVSA